ncbi:hypothetical protein BN12_160015 [Nostocoides japonicum T1-X7]|uniref:Uncharacterized protein n=1 Tax=Nostocoides japonicum T1-X7 TaxID=1194083 RepID=A0A077LYJ6_9MICO|nr:hypothetical protein [Tetrasphaera japonica]CCH77040.1 hypothetical protein BN12_160015 [Tetrasphaera japonica T1-X7]
MDVDARGHFAVAAPRDSLAQFRDSAGNVNLELYAHDHAGNVASLSFPLTVVSSAEGTASAKTAALVPVTTTDLTIAPPNASVDANSSTASSPGTPGPDEDPASGAGGTEPTEPKKWSAPISESSSFVDGSGASAPSNAPQAPSCQWRLISDLGYKTVWVGGTYVTNGGAKADLVYGSGASSTLGIGVSTSGSYGSFKASGSTTVSSNSSVNFPAYTGLQHDYTQFDYGKYGLSCDGIYLNYKVQARYWAGGASVYHPSSAPTANYCVSQVSGSSFTKSSSTAYTFSTGADVSGAIGIDLSTRTGYTPAAKVTYSFTSTRRLCGTSGAPTATPSRLVTKS